MFSLSLKAICLVAALFPSLGLASPYPAIVEWKFDNVPGEGLKDITVGFNMAYSTPKAGLRGRRLPILASTAPNEERPADSTRRILQLHLWSSTTSSTCHGGADGHSDGVSCSVDFPGNYSNTFNIAVENTGGTTWRGTIVDTETADSHVIGEWTLPASAKGINRNHIGFVEYYPWNGKQPHVCKNLPRAAVTFYDHTSKTSGAGTGKISKVYQSGDCVNKEDYFTSKVSRGVYIEAGFT